MSNLYSIGELSREFGVTTRTIRFYEDQGLLCPTRDGQNRIYQGRDRVRLRLILRGKRLEGAQLRSFIEKIRTRRSELLIQKDDIEHVLDELDTLEQRCTGLLAAEGDGGRSAQ
jgi:DNA-binding transcriptional MerR regulator